MFSGSSSSEGVLFRVSSSSSSINFALLFILLTLGASSGVTTADSVAQSPSASIADPAQIGGGGGVDKFTLHNLRQLGTSHRDLLASLPAKNRKVREISRGQPDHVEDDLPQVLSSSPKIKSLYPSLSSSGELIRLFRPLSWGPDKTIGMHRLYLPGVGYFSRGGRAASSNFIRFGRSDNPQRFLEDEDGINGGGDVTMLSRAGVKKKNNFIRLGRENPRQTNFIRLGRSGPPSQAGEFYNSGYITPALSDPFRDDEEGRHEFN